MSSINKLLNSQIVHEMNFFFYKNRNCKSTLICLVCQEEHIIPKKGFIVNNRLQKLLTLELNALKFDCQIYNGCTKEIEDAKEKVVKIHRNSKLGRHVYNKKKKKKVTTIERLSKRYKIQ